MVVCSLSLVVWLVIFIKYYLLQRLYSRDVCSFTYFSVSGAGLEAAGGASSVEEHKTISSLETICVL